MALNNCHTLTKYIFGKIVKILNQILKMGVTCRTNYFGYFLVWIINRYQTYKWMNGFSYQMGVQIVVFWRIIVWSLVSVYPFNSCSIRHLCYFILWTVNMVVDTTWCVRVVDVMWIGAIFVYAFSNYISDMVLPGSQSLMYLLT